MSGVELQSILANLGELIFVLCGVVCFSAAFRGLKNEKSRIGTFVFWTLLGLTFALGKFVNTAGYGTVTEGKPIPAWIVGVIVVILGVLSATKQVAVPKFTESTLEERTAASEKYRWKVFIPAISLALFALILTSISFTYPDVATKITLPSALSIGGAALIALLVGVLFFRPNVKETQTNVDRLLMTVGPTSILPQLLIALGNVFTAAGVGTVISNIFASIIPANNIIIGVIMYLVGMALFTMIMGNAFAAFQVITIGVGIPFVIANGGNPAIVGSLALSAGFCGTLLTPMAANFNIIPVSVLEMKNKYGVIKTQLPMAIFMFAVHIVLMLVLAF